MRTFRELLDLVIGLPAAVLQDALAVGGVIDAPVEGFTGRKLQDMSASLQAPAVPAALQGPEPGHE